MTAPDHSSPAPDTSPSASPHVQAAYDSTARLNIEFALALRVLRDLGQEDLACRLAARGWSALRHTYPAEARRLECLLHVLAHPVPTQKET